MTIDASAMTGRAIFKEARGRKVSDSERCLVSPGQAGRICAVTRATVYRWMRAGLIEWVRLPSGTPRIYLDCLLLAPTLNPEPSGFPKRNG
jgi:hypothetical protein